MNQTHWTSHVLIKSAVEKDGEWYVYGPVASLKKDFEGETLEKAGVLNGLRDFFRLGAQIDIDHKFPQSGDWDDIIGKGVSVQEIDGIPNLVAQLLKGKPQAVKVWNHINSGGEAGFSIYGIAKARNPKDHKHILDTSIKMVTIALMPMGMGETRIQPGRPQSLSDIAKSLIIKALPNSSGRSMPLEEDEDETAMPPMPPTSQSPMPLDTPPASPDPSMASPPMDTAQPSEEGMDQGMPPADGEQPTQDYAKSQVNYGPGDGVNICANCENFQDGVCALVKGMIKPQDTCDLFEPMDNDGDEQMPQDQGAAPPMVEKGRRATAHTKCRKCGGKMYCLSCHRSQSSQFEKAYTTGEGAVMPGESGAKALRKQSLKGGAEEPGTPAKLRRKRKKREEGGVGTSVQKSAIVRALEKVGVKNPELTAKAVEQRIMRLYDE